MDSRDLTIRRRPLGIRALLALLLCALALPACGGEEDAPSTPTPTPTPLPAGIPHAIDDALYARFRAKILPKADEVAWEQIDWEISYADGLRAASEQQKPLLLWVMNGHPFGCT